MLQSGRGVAGSTDARPNVGFRTAMNKKPRTAAVHAASGMAGSQYSLRIWRQTDQRCLIVRAGATAAGAVACLDTLPARLATLAGVRGRRPVQNDSTASVTAALISA